MVFVKGTEEELMQESMKVTTTTVEGWQSLCRRWAEMREPFELHGVTARHLNVCKELCDAFDYKCEYDSRDHDHAAVFVPLAD